MDECLFYILINPRFYQANILKTEVVCIPATSFLIFSDFSIVNFFNLKVNIVLVRQFLSLSFFGIKYPSPLKKQR